MKSLLHGATVCALAASFCLGNAARAVTDADDGPWRFAVTPYVWLPNINGKLRFDLPSGAGGESQIDGNPFLQDLKFAFLIAGEARKGPWSIFTDLIYLDFDGTQSGLRSVSGSGGVISIPRDQNLDTKTNLSGWAWTTAGGYTVLSTDAARVDVFGGVRYLSVRASLDWSLATTFTGAGITVQRTGSASGKADLVDAIVGTRGRFAIGSGDWFVPYYLDVGAGSSALTWQAMAGVGYTFKSWDVLLAYRHLSYDQGDNKLLENVRFDGPAIGATFRF
ncbi:MAG TPA: hypothetical protein VMG60_09975 [Burkholderiaceae bacterium]|nr:hypothetical protein [Burkholderiaceae bacterium]